MNFKNAAFSVTMIASLLLSSSAGAQSGISSLDAINQKEDVLHIQNDIGVSQNVIDSFIAEASNEVQKEKLTKSLKGLAAISEKHIYDYISVGDNGYYFYEEDANQNKTALFVPIDQTQTNIGPSVTDDVYSKNGLVSPQANTGDGLPDGIGGRQYVVKSGTYISTSAILATSAQVSRGTGENAYTYTGFMAGANAADLGLMYDSNVGIGGSEQGWKPTAQINGVTTNSSFESPNNQVQSANAYKVGSQVVYYAWYNYNQKIRLKIDGTAICANLGCSDSTDSPLTTIITSNTSYNIAASSFQKWKILSVVTGDNVGKNYAVFSNIKVDGVAVPSSAFPAPDQDYATVTRDASNNVTINVTG